ncbi:hypothetical protein [Pseudomonas putida]|nr:hypothetical protein [Pseudomonas putida]MDP9524063.1 hypothetical protein [Pseudomonas putida]
MDDFASRFSQQGYEPRADDRFHLLKALNEQLGNTLVSGSNACSN